MTAFTKVLAGGVAIAALAAAAPASAQYYPGYGSPYGGNVVGQIIGQVLGGGYGGGYGGYGGGYGAYGGTYGGGYAGNSQAAVSQCVGAVQQRLSGGYGYNSGYGGYNGYGNARVLGISRVEPRGGGGLTVRGVATSGQYGAGYAYGGAYGAQQQPADLTFRCRTDYRGFVTGVSVDRAQPAYGVNYGSGYTPYANDYSQYGYRRY